MRGGAQHRCGFQAGVRPSVRSTTPTGSTGGGLPAGHLPEGFSNPSPFKVRYAHVITPAQKETPVQTETPVGFAPV